MIDIFTVVVPHVLMAIAVWRLLTRDDLDHDPILPDTRQIAARRQHGPGPGPGQAPGKGGPGA
jgi:hypothetical protein